MCIQNKPFDWFHLFLSITDLVKLHFGRYFKILLKNSLMFYTYPFFFRYPTPSFLSLRENSVGVICFKICWTRGFLAYWVLRNCFTKVCVRFMSLIELVIWSPYFQMRKNSRLLIAFFLFRPTSNLFNSIFNILNYIEWKDLFISLYKL